MLSSRPIGVPYAYKLVVKHPPSVEASRVMAARLVSLTRLQHRSAAAMYRDGMRFYLRLKEACFFFNTPYIFLKIDRDLRWLKVSPEFLLPTLHVVRCGSDWIDVVLVMSCHDSPASRRRPHRTPRRPWRWPSCISPRGLGYRLPTTSPTTPPPFSYRCVLRLHHRRCGMLENVYTECFVWSFPLFFCPELPARVGSISRKLANGASVEFLARIVCSSFQFVNSRRA